MAFFFVFFNSCKFYSYFYTLEGMGINKGSIMTQQQALQLFEEKKVRTVWDDEQEKWYFSIVDVVAVLTDSSDPKQYLKKMRTRDSELQNNWGTICTPVRMVATDGKLRLVQKV